MKKVGGAVVSVSLWLVTASVLLLCVLLGRLFFAPINVGFAREQIISQASDLLPGWNVRFSTAKIGWDWRDVRPWVVITDVQLVDRRNRLTARLPRAEVGLGFSGILAGLGVSTIDIESASIRVTDLGGFSDATDDSLFDDLFGESGIPQPEIFIPLTEAFNRFTLRLLDNAPALNRVGFDDLNLRIYRGEDLSEAQISVSSFDLRQAGEDLSLAAQVEASIGGNPISTRLAGKANPTRGDLSLLLAISDFYPTSIPLDAGLPSVLQYFNLPIDVSLGLELNSSIGLQSAGIEAVLGEGEIFDGGDAFSKPAPVTYGLIDATYNVAENILVFDQINIDLEDQKIEGEGLMYWHQTSPSPGMQFELRTDDIPVLNVLDYWPIKRHPDGRERGARAWINQHMIAGVTKNAVFTVDVAPSGAGAYAEESEYQLTFDFQDLDTKFMQTMPPILNASGSAVLTKTKLDIAIDSGELLGMPVRGSSALLDDIHVRNGAVGTFNIFTRGPVKTVMELIDNPPLRVAEKANLDIERLDGTATVKAVVNTPLYRAPVESVRYDVTAQIADAKVADLLGGEGLTEGQLSIKVTPDNLSAAGSGDLNGVPVGLRWEEDFAAGRSDPSAETTLVVLNGALDAVDMAALGVDVSDFLHGKAQAEASFQGRNFRFTRGSFSADASSAVLEIPQLAWRKSVGSPANITGGVIFTDQGSTVAPLIVQGEDIDLLASMEFGPAGSGEFSAELQARQIGRNEFIAHLNQPSEGALSINVEATSFDLGAYLARQERQSVALEHEVVSQENGSNFDLKLSSGAILLENDEQWNDARLELSFQNGEPTSLTLDAVSGEENVPLVVAILNEVNPETGKRPFRAETANGGQVLRGLGFFSHIDGGQLTLEAETAGWDSNWTIDGVLNVSSSNLISKEALGPNVTEGTVSGLDSYLEDGPLELDVLEVPFTYNGDILEFDGLKANGPTLGLTMEGEIATAQGLINVNGVVVPAYGINSLLGNIPLVGGLFSGGDGKGLFGVAYRVKGTTEEPDVNVNTLSGLAPGFLRLLFEGRKGRVADVEAPAAEVRPETTDDPDDPIGEGGFYR